MKIKNFIIISLISVCSLSYAKGDSVESIQADSSKVNLGQFVALYPNPLTVLGTEVNGKVNWMTASHLGIIGHDRLLLSLMNKHITNKGIKESKKVSVNLVSREMLPKADYVGGVGGGFVDKSNAFPYHLGLNGSPIIDESPVSMECEVESIFETQGFDNFVCAIKNTYASKAVLSDKNKLNYEVLKPVLFEFPTYSYLATGEVIGSALRLNKTPSMAAKLPMQKDGIVRLSKIEVLPEFLDEYLKYAKEVGEVSLREEPGVLTMYAVSDKKAPNKITILETYASEDAYKKHIASKHFQKYKKETLHMVKNLSLEDQEVINSKNKLNNFITN